MTKKSHHLYLTIGSSIQAANNALVASGILPQGIDQSKITIEPTRDPAHGDIATNDAMVLAKAARQNPKVLAELIAQQLRLDSRIERVDIAGPGFINLVLRPTAWHDSLRQILEQGGDYGRSDVGSGELVNVEYVSANPTGPMHVGHCRGAVFGDALSSLLQFTGYSVTREYYINDAGAQIDVLARSAFLRYREALGETIGDVPEGLYPGDYLKPVGKALAKQFGPSLKEASEELRLAIVRARAIEMMMSTIRHDLKKLNINHDRFSSERALIHGRITIPQLAKTWRFEQIQALVDELQRNPTWGSLKLASAIIARGVSISASIAKRIHACLTFYGAFGPMQYEFGGEVAALIADLRERGLVYQGRLPRPKGAVDDDWEDREQTLFRTTDFGDDIDRPLLKSDGSFTYFASDIAYHRNKFERGFRNLVDVWGADHGGYIRRVEAAVAAVTDRKATLDVKIVQLVKLLRGGEPVKMSKRAGEFVTLREVVDEVGADPVRFMMLFRKNDAVLDFDLAKVVEQSRDNPVFYVQYAHARCHSVFRNAASAVPNLPKDSPKRSAFLAGARLDRLTEDEFTLIRQLALYPRTVEAAALAHEPHRIAFYLFDLASEFHAFWTRGNAAPHLRFIIENDTELTIARLALVQGVVSVLASGLGVLGVGAPEEMR